jgi:hypothetical protein
MRYYGTPSSGDVKFNVKLKTYRGQLGSWLVERGSGTRRDRDEDFL